MKRLAGLDVTSGTLERRPTLPSRWLAASCANLLTVFTLVVRFDLPDGATAREFDELTAAAVPLIRAGEPGTLLYETYVVEGEPLARVFYEVYRDRDAHAEHERQPHTAAFLTRVRTLVAATRVESLSQPQPGGAYAAGDEATCS